MDKRYQVFVSSTFEDLQVERKEVMQALLELDCIPCGMELFPASNEDQWSLIKRVIDDCDYYILIIGGRYGSTNDEGIGFTEMEYRYAIDLGKPVIAFLHKYPELIPSGKTEQDPVGKAKLEDFKELAQKKMANFWTNPDDLGSVVSRSMVKLIKQFPAVGWVKADNVTDEKSMKEILSLQKENEELKKQISENITRPPQGAEQLAHGDDMITMHLEFTGKTKDYGRYSCSMPCAVTWNEVYSDLSPHLLIEDIEISMKKVIVDHLKDSLHQDLIEFKKTQKYVELSSFSISDVEFQKIKVQFKAIGLIKQSTKNRSVKDNGNYWTLTPYGDFVMTQLLAVKKDAQANS